MNSKESEQAMPLARFIAEAMVVLETDAKEVFVERARMLRNNPGPEGAFVNQSTPWSRAFRNQAARHSLPENPSNAAGETL